MFLRAAAAASAAWAAVDLVQVEEALAWTAQHAAPGEGRAAGVGISVLTKDQAAALDAMSARILPAVDGKPGAHDAGVVFFIDRSLATFNAAQKPVYVDGVQDLNRRAATDTGTAGATFATLTPAQQDAILRAVETTPFFQAVRFDTIVGTFAVPTYGGNRDHVGWRLIGHEHQPAFQPPFGFYDADANRPGGNRPGGNRPGANGLGVDGKKG
jgi:gluconate 2-dehydrogenase gamma chain